MLTCTIRSRGNTSFCRILGGFWGKHFVSFEAHGAYYEGYAGNLFQRDVERRVFLVV